MLGQRRRHCPSSINTGHCILLAGRAGLQWVVYTRTPTQCRLTVGPPSVTLLQPRTSIVSQRMSTRRKIYGVEDTVFMGTKARGSQSQGWVDVGEVA